jgi:hypothetical protein
MGNTILIQLTNKKAMMLLNDMEELDLIKVLKENVPATKIKLSDKYRGVFSQEDAKSFNDHTQIMRGEWDNI